jgi:hypothetical protein
LEHGQTMRNSGDRIIGTPAGLAIGGVIMATIRAPRSSYHPELLPR